MPTQEITYDDELLQSAENDSTTEVSIEFDPDAEYNLPMVPLNDTWHQATIENRGVKDKETETIKEFDGPRPWGNVPATYWTMIDATVVDPGGPQNNKHANGNITTHDEKSQDGTNRGSLASAYYRAITGDPIPGAKQGAHIAAVAKELRNKPLVWIRTRLEGQDQDAQKAFKARKAAGQLEPNEKAPPTFRGQKEFTQNGKLTGVKVLEDGTRIVGRAVIQDVKHISFVPPGQKG